ncbi:MAG: segregation/condensation protein A [Clostridia bacterium]|nr:segregation/condensation protein A [Clostridia bacterium]MBR6781212.1 segregation/condensation protein A [Clostridia bacterium]
METIQYKLDVFEGPLDLLLHLITKHKLNINDISIFALVEQYTAYIANVSEEDLEQASEFLEMAARLVHIKTVSLLPVYEDSQNLKKELERELIEYRDCKLLAAQLSKQTEGFSSLTRTPEPIPADMTYHRVHDSTELLKAYLNAVGKRLRRLPPPFDSFKGIVAKKVVSVSNTIRKVVKRIAGKGKHSFISIFEQAESRSELVATFLAVLELTKRKNILLESEDDGKLSITLLSEPEGDIDFE